MMLGCCLEIWMKLWKKLIKGGGKQIRTTSRSYLENFIVETGCIDLGLSGPMITWRNNREGLRHIKQRLDGSLASQEWLETFPKARVQHLISNESDHNRIRLELWRNNISNKKLRFEAMWIRDISSKEIVKSAWELSITRSKPFQLTRKIKNRKNALRKWNKTLLVTVKKE